MRPARQFGPAPEPISNRISFMFARILKLVLTLSVAQAPILLSKSSRRALRSTTATPRPTHTPPSASKSCGWLMRLRRRSKCDLCAMTVMAKENFSPKAINWPQLCSLKWRLPLATSSKTSFLQGSQRAVDRSLVRYQIGLDVLTAFHFGFDHHVTQHRSDDNCTAEEGPVRRPLAEKEKYPDRIQDRFDIADNARVERAQPARHCSGKQNVGDADLDNAEVSNVRQIRRADAPLHCSPKRRRANHNGDQIAIDGRGSAVNIACLRMTQQQEIEREANS